MLQKTGRGLDVWRMIVGMKRILFVEDNADDIELTFRMFEKCGVEAQVQVAKDGPEAIETAARLADTLKLIILDLHLPKLGGQEVLKVLSANPRTKSIPVAVVTITGNEEEPLLKGPVHISAYIRKPIELHTFLNLYRTHVDTVL